MLAGLRAKSGDVCYETVTIRSWTPNGGDLQLPVMQLDGSGEAALLDPARPAVFKLPGNAHFLTLPLPAHLTFSLFSHSYSLSLLHTLLSNCALHLTHPTQNVRQLVQVLQSAGVCSAAYLGPQHPHHAAADQPSGSFH